MNKGFKRDTVKRLLQDMGVQLRTAGQTRAKKKNIDYFLNENANMAWILGFLASDGTISKNRNTIKIGLSNKDKEILEKIKKEINIENKITEYTTNKGFDVVELSWTCQEHKQQLAKYGIIPEKTFKLKPPYELNRQYWKDYLRGYFDGDGCITIHNNYPYFQITSGTKEILEWIVNFLYEDYNIPKVNINKFIRTNTGYEIRYASKATKEIYNIIYSDMNNLYLERKYYKYTELIK